jgi:regulator of sirC expression with transglutaminase-like and TPR domain
MSLSGATAKPLSDQQRAALVSLLADDDPSVYADIRSRILAYGGGAAVWLRPHALSGDPLLRRRTQEIIQFLAKRSAHEAFLEFCLHHGEVFDIEEAAWVLARTQYPEINLEAYQALLDHYAGLVAARFQPGATAQQKLSALNEFLFSDLGVVGNTENYYDPENSYLNRVIDRRTGNPISLCQVYLLLGRRLQLPIAGIGMPGHFLCRYQSSTEEIFIDVFNQGQFLSKADCIRYLHATGRSYAEDLLGPASARRLLARVCTNLHHIYADLRMTEELARFEQYLLALNRLT